MHAVKSANKVKIRSKMFGDLLVIREATTGRFCTMCMSTYFAVGLVVELVFNHYYMTDSRDRGISQSAFENPSPYIPIRTASYGPTFHHNTILMLLLKVN